MPKREEFISVISTLKALSPTVTNEQHKALLQQAVNKHGLSIDEASKILDTSGLSVRENIDYFEILGLSYDVFEKQSEKNIVMRIEAAHNKLYSDSLRAGGLPRADGRTQEQWRTLLNQARDTLIDVQKRKEYFARIMFQEDLFNRTSNDVPNTQRESEQTAPNISQSILTPSHSQVDSVKVTPTPNVSGDMMLIPAGDFQMGSSDEKANADEKPAHTVFVDAFYMDKNLVTNAQYSEFVAANPHWGKPSKWYEWNHTPGTSVSKLYHDGDYLKHWDRNSYPDENADHPVTWVSWYAAMAYAKWVEKRLPTEAEWEKAACGGLVGQKYPWGNTIDATKANYNIYIADTTSVGQYPPNAYGLYDMAGNVWEWCLDMYDADFYTRSPQQNPISGGNTTESVDHGLMDETILRVLRGGSWLDTAEYVRCTYRSKNTPTRTLARIGFRCVKPVIY